MQILIISLYIIMGLSSAAVAGSGVIAILQMLKILQLRTNFIPIFISFTIIAILSVVGLLITYQLN